MESRLLKIQQNIDTEISLGSLHFDEETTQLFADALQKNTKIIKLDLSICSLSDKQFQTFASSLIARKIILSDLILDTNNLTPNSLDTFTKLFTNKLVKAVYIYRNDSLVNDEKTMSILSKLGKDHDVKIINENHLTREYPQRFPKRVFGAPKKVVHEEKEQHPVVHTNKKI